MSTIAFAAKMGGEWYDISFRYDRDLVAMIKAVIPSSMRKWDQSNKVWSAQRTWAHAFANEARQVGYTTTGIPDATSTPPGQGAGSPFFGPYSSVGWSASGPSWASPPWQKRSQGPRQPPPLPPKPPPPALTENWARELMRRSPPELREKLYKALARVLHTDLGGDQTLMQELNDARNEEAS